MAIDWRRRRPMLGNVLGGLSGPAIKPIALRCVYQAAQAVKTPLIGIGGIATIDDVMEFLVAGATAVQIGTANFYNPTVSMKLLDALPAALAKPGATSRERRRRHAANCSVTHLTTDHRSLPTTSHACSLRHSTDRPVSLGQLLRRDPPVHRPAARRRGVLLHRQPARADDGPRSRQCCGSTRSTRRSTCWPWGSIRARRCCSCSRTCRK